MENKTVEFSCDDHYKGDDFHWWSRALTEIAEYFGEYVNPTMGWHEPFADGKTPLQAFFEEHPEHDQDK